MSLRTALHAQLGALIGIATAIAAGSAGLGLGTIVLGSVTLTALASVYLQQPSIWGVIWPTAGGDGDD